MATEDALAEYKKLHPDANLDAELKETNHVVQDVPIPLLARAGAVLGQRIKATPSDRFTAVHHTGTRSLSLISCEVIHCTQSSTAIGSATWFTNPAAAGSAHKVADNRICYRTLDAKYIPWAAPGMNTFGMHFEMVGFTTWTNREWLDNHLRTLKRTSYRIAVDSKRFGFPIKWLEVNDLKNGERYGVTDHWAVSHAFRLSGHYDPRDSYDSHTWGYPNEYILERARFYKKRM